MRPVLLLLLGLLALPARAATIVVDVLGDPLPDGCSPGSCSLREAITLANNLPGKDTILLPATGHRPPATWRSS
jgi:CSLREA domain-containing protein